MVNETATTSQAHNEPTPGPWTVEADSEGIYIRMEALGEKDEYLAVYASPDKGRREADADLIAAAPDLLAAAEQVVSHFEEWGIEENAFEGCEMLRAAIAKARGRS